MIKKEESKDIHVESFSEASLMHDLRSDSDLIQSMNDQGPLALKGLLGQNSSLLAQIEKTPLKSPSKRLVHTKARETPDRDIQRTFDFQGMGVSP